MEKIRLIKFAINQLVEHYLQEVSLYTDLNLCKPSHVIVAITTLCNLKCKQCNFWRYKSIKGLSTMEWKKILIDLKDWLGSFYLSFTGGEPLLRKDIIELIEFASKLGLVTSLSTNGTLINKEVADKLIHSGLNRLAISLDGMNARTHDFLRGRGTFKKVISNIEHLTKNNKDLKIGIQTILWDKNLDEVIDLIKWEKNKGLIGLFLPLLDLFLFMDSRFLSSGKYYGGSGYKKNKFWPKDTSKVEEVIDNIILMKKRGYSILNSVKQLESMKEYFKDHDKIFQNLNCAAGTRSFFISPMGDMHLCMYKPPVGNLRKQSAKEIWLSKKAADSRKQIKKCKRSCILTTCNFNWGLKTKIHMFRKII